MTIDQSVAVCVLAASLLLFGWGRWRYDLVALAAMATVVFAGLVPPNEALKGFGHPAVFTVAEVLIISRAMRNSGIVDAISDRIMELAEQPFAHVVVLTATVTVASAFMNNVGALALMLPVAVTTAYRQNRSPSLVLMPLAFGSILGGLMTMIGTPPNVIIALYRQDVLGAPFSMFDFSPVGAPIALIGAAFVALIGWRFLPRDRRAPSARERLFEINEYIFEIRVPQDSGLVGQRLGDIEAFQDDDRFDVVGLVRGKAKVVTPSRLRVLRENDILIVRADPAEISNLLSENKLELASHEEGVLDLLRSDRVALIEAVVAPGSRLDGRDTRYLRRVAGTGLHLLALARQGQPIRRRLNQVRFAGGDVLLLQGHIETLEESMSNLGLLPLAEREIEIGRQRRIGLTVLIFGSAIAAAALGFVPIVYAFLIAILAFVLTDILPVRDLYRDIDWPVIVLLGAMIPVGRALEQTGTTEFLADHIIGLTGALPVWGILALMMVVTMTLSDVINNAATAVVMAPIAVAIANGLGVSIDPFLMGVAVAASCAFLTPIGHQSNTLVMGPGGYQFGDYWRMGLPLEAIIILVSVPLILLVWPL